VKVHAKSGNSRFSQGKRLSSQQHSLRRISPPNSDSPVKSVDSIQMDCARKPAAGLVRSHAASRTVQAAQLFVPGYDDVE
jgi:hypothetical protein